MVLALYIPGTRGPGETIVILFVAAYQKLVTVFCKNKTIQILPLAIASYAFHKKTESES